MLEISIYDGIDYIFQVLELILMGSMSYIHLLRIIDKLKWYYNDWIIILCLIWFLLSFLCLLVWYATDFFDSVDSVIISMLTSDLRWVFFFTFEIMNMIYSILLMVYCLKLSSLIRGHTFAEVKKRINRIEIIIILASVVSVTFYLIMTVIITILVKIYSWVHKADGEYK